MEFGYRYILMQYEKLYNVKPKISTFKTYLITSWIILNFLINIFFFLYRECHLIKPKDKTKKHNHLHTVTPTHHCGWDQEVSSGSWVALPSTATADPGPPSQS